MTPPQYYIGVDIGGTNIRAARFAADTQHPDRKTKILTHASRGLESVLDRLEQAVREVSDAGLADVAAVGVAAPGPIDPYTGVVMSAPNLPGWENLPLKKIMEDRLQCQVFVGNDANIAALGEWRFGAGRGHKDVIYLTISTGIGGGIITGGRLLLGATGLAAETGHILSVVDGPMCACGQRGHLEAVASGTAIGRAARERLAARPAVQSKILELAGGSIEDVTGAIVGAAAQAGDELALEVVEEAGTHIGRGIASLLHLFNPSIVICGGGVSMLGNIILDPIRAATQNSAMGEGYWRNCPIVLGALGDDAGLIGAGALAMEEARLPAREA